MEQIQIQSIFVSPEHGYVGRDPEGAGEQTMQTLDEVDCVAGKGLIGDRYFDHKADYIGQATFFSADVFEAACSHVGNESCVPWAMRRNIMVSGIDLNGLIGREFEIDGVRFLGTEECAPCRWMDRSIGEGARSFLKGRGGLRVKILSSGKLRCGTSKLSF
jgi:MOSC domain-containing protein YiiM